MKLFFPVNGNQKLFYPSALSSYRIFLTEKKMFIFFKYLTKAEKWDIVKRPGTEPLALPTQYWDKQGHLREPKPRLREILADHLAPLQL